MAHYFSQKPTAPLRPKEVRIRFKNNAYTFLTGSEVFSKTRLDPGSAVLLDSSIDIPAKTVLDLGCGTGIVGILFKKFHPAADVFLSDINKRAASLAKKNAMLHKVDVDVREGDLFEPWDAKRFDLILLNPPQQAGRDLCYRMIDESAQHLADKGMLCVVGRHNKGGSMLKERMKAVFGDVEDIGKKGIFRVYGSRSK